MVAQGRGLSEAPESRAERSRRSSFTGGSVRGAPAVSRSGGRAPACDRFSPRFVFYPVDRTTLHEMLP